MRMLKIYVVVLVIVILPNTLNPNPHQTIMSTAIAICVVIAMTAFSMMLGYKKTKKMYESLQITLDDNGIELKAPMAAYKRIDWSEAAYIEKKNGDIRIYNTTVSATSRWWTGNGVIVAPREINDRDQLLLSLDTHMNK
jgi:hypothetical protein